MLERQLILFRKAGEIADRAGEDTICEEHVRDAQKEAERTGR